eukprot:IDg23690t1
MDQKTAVSEVAGLNPGESTMALSPSEACPSLRNVSQLCHVAVSKTSKKNMVRARAALSKYTRDMKIKDLVEVNAFTGTLVLNLIHDYCNMGTEAAKADNTMTGFIQGLRSVYEEEGHTGNWYVDKKNGTAHG